MDAGTLTTSGLPHLTSVRRYQGAQSGSSSEIAAVTGKNIDQRMDAEYVLVSLHRHVINFVDRHKELRERLKKLYDEVHSNPMSSMRDLRFDFIEEIRQLSIQVVDIQSNSVMSTMPPEGFIELRQRLREIIGESVDNLA